MQRRMPGLTGLLGPAFVASMAYVDPGNVAANLTAGATHGYLLVWVLVAASLMAMVVQYLSAKLGVVTGRSLSALVGEWLDHRRGRGAGLLYGGQALLIAIATDIAEVIGGALGLNLLFGVPLWLGGVLVGLTTMLLLEVLRSRGEKAFEIAVSGILAVVALGFMAAMVWAPPDLARTVGGLQPRLAGADSLTLAAAMLGATVMPHAIYLHSTLTADRHRAEGGVHEPTERLLRAQRLDVAGALVLSGTVNVSMLLFAASALAGSGSIDSIEAAHRIVHERVGWAPAAVFGFGLLASGVGSAVVGTHAGARIMRDLLPWRMSPNARRAATLVPAVMLLSLGMHPSELLVTSQLVLSFGIAFALVPLVLLTSSRRVMGVHRDSLPLRVAAWTVVALVVSLNIALLVLAL